MRCSVQTYNLYLLYCTSFCVVRFVSTENQPEETLGHVYSPGPGGGEKTPPRGENQALIEALESSLLKQFGLSKRPKPDPGKIIIPQFMKDLYNMRTDADTEDREPEQNANTIRSFHHIEHHSPQADQGGVTRLLFNTTLTTVPEALETAVLRLYRHAITDTSQINNRRDFKHRLDIYEIIKPQTRNTEAITRLVDTRLVDVRNSSWESFDVSPAVHRWKANANSVQGLEVHFLARNGAPPMVRHDHVRLRRSAQLSEAWHDERPLLVTYSADGSDRRKRRATKRRSHRGRKGHKEQCRRHPLYVDFTDVGWNNWIVAPPGYKAYYCHGDCPFPLSDHLNSTNHAIVQTLVNSVNPRAVPKACCVPTELSPISMLYVDENQKVVLKNYQDMVVEGCGCR